MKKSYLMIVAAAALFSACANEVIVDKTAMKTQDQPFTFSAYANMVTKAGTNSAKLQDFYTVFGVYGWKTVNGSAKEVFKNIPNEYFAADEAGTTVYTGGKPSDEWSFAAGWYYENVRYWDKLASGYEFFAIAPYEAVTPTYSVSAGDYNFSIGSTSSRYDISTEKNLALSGSPAVPQGALSYSGFNKDYMIAEKSIATTSDVQLIFHHILTKLNVKVQKDNSYKGKQELKVNKLTIGNLAKQGNFVYNNSGMTVNGWSTTGKYDIAIESAYSLTAATHYSGKYWIETLIFPQTATCMATEPQSSELSGLYLYIQYQIGDEVFDAYYDLAYIFDSELSDGSEGGDAGTFEFKQGSQYELTLTVGPKPIHFDAKVSTWTTETAASLTVN